MIESAIRHQPWSGPDYGKTEPRLLVLGESHHGDDPEAVDVTGTVVERWLSGESGGSLTFFTKLAVALSGEEPKALNRRAVFGPIAFYNYFTEIAPGARAAAPDGGEPEQAFREVLERLGPTHMLVLGDGKLWKKLPNFDAPEASGYRKRLADQEFHLGRYRTASAAPLAMCIHHPSSAFNGRDWYPRIQAFLRE